jgi:probable HAF family extracellular repeat protein
MKRSIGPAMLVIALTGFATLAEAQTMSGPPPHYTVINLGSLKNSGFSNGYGGVTNSGWISGDSALRGDRTEHAFVWRGNVMTDLGTLGGANSSVPWPQKNTFGLIVGQAQGSIADPRAENWGAAYGCNNGANGICDGSQNVQLGFLWQNGVMTALPTLGGNNSTATSDNNNNPGQVVGWAETGAQDPMCPTSPTNQPNQWQQLQIRAVVYEPVVLRNKRVAYLPRELPPVTDDQDDLSAAFGINDNGDVVGLTGTCGTPDTSALAVHAVLWPNGYSSGSILPGLGGVMNIAALAINNGGQIAGISDTTNDVTTHAVLWQNGAYNKQPTDLGVLPGDVLSVANDINASGQVVGVSCDANFSCRAFLWENGAMIDLNSLIPPNSKLYLTYGGGISDSGEIAGTAYDSRTGESPAFLAIPAPTGQIAGDSAVKINLPANIHASLKGRLRLGHFGDRATAQQ